MIRLYKILACVFLFGEVFSQLPATDIFMFNFVEYDSELNLKQPTCLSGFNEGGYNNQPYFISPGELYISTNHEGNLQTDIVALDYDLGNYMFITKTDSISEFSPTLMPDRLHFSVIRQEGTDQWLWQYPLDKSNGGNPLLNLNDVGYHCWLNQDEVALFRVTDPITLSVANVKTGKITDKLNDIGRCFQLDDEDNLIFVHKITSDFWYLKKLNPITNKISIISEIDVEDFVLLPSGSFLKGKGSKLYKLGIKDSNWTEVADLNEYGILNINRMAVSRNKLVLISNKN